MNRFELPAIVFLLAIAGYAIYGVCKGLWMAAM